MMNTSVTGSLRAVAKALRLYTPLRSLFNTVVLSRSHVTTHIDGIACAFYTPTRTIRETIAGRMGEEDILAHFMQHLRDGDVVWDVGAAFGLYTVPAAHRLRVSGSIVAFEPEPRMNKLLHRNIRLNHLSNVTVQTAALGSRDTTTVLYPSDTPNAGTSALVQRTDYRLQKKGVSIPMLRSDSLAGIPPPAVVKIDVEGAEADVLSGMGVLLKGVRLLYCEVHPHLLPLFHASVDNVCRAASEAGLTMLTRRPRGTQVHYVWQGRSDA